MAALPFLILLSFTPKYRKSIPARFFLWKNPPFENEAIWFHACSLGEVKSLGAILQRLSHEANLSVITHTGYEAAGAMKVVRRFLPYEIFLPFWVQKQKALVVLEAELWYMLFYVAKKRGTKTFLLNARISDRSYGRYKKFAWFYRKIFENVDVVFAQSEKDAIRLEELGAKEVKVTGNIKAFHQIAVTKQLSKPAKELVVLASTHEKEEMLLLQRLNFANRVVVVVPRHPERFGRVAEEVARFAKEKGLSFGLYSKEQAFEKDIVVVDQMGLLIDIYAIADVVLLGGSFVEGVGGHNPLEPAHFGVKLLSGNYIFNQQALFPLVENVVFTDVDAIEEAIAQAKPSKIAGKVDIEPIVEALENVV